MLADARLIANLMDETYEQSVVAGGGPKVYSVGDMAAMASAKVSGKTPEEAGMEAQKASIIALLQKLLRCFELTQIAPSSLSNF